MHPSNLPLIVSIEKEAQDEVNEEEKEKGKEEKPGDIQDEVNEEGKEKQSEVQNEEKPAVFDNEDGKEKEKTEKADASLEYEEALQMYQEEAGKQIQAFIEDTVKLFKKHPFWQNVNSREKEGPYSLKVSPSTYFYLRYLVGMHREVSFNPNLPKS